MWPNTRRWHCTSLTKFAVSHFIRWDGALVFLATGSWAHVALVQLLGWGGSGLILAALKGEVRGGNVNQVVSQEFSPSRKHGGDVWVFGLGIDRVLQHVDNIVRLGECMGIDGGPRLVYSIGVVGLNETQENISAGSPVAMNDVITFSGWWPEFARRTSDGHSVDQQLVLHFACGRLCAVPVLRVWPNVQYFVLLEDEGGPCSTSQIGW